MLRGNHSRMIKCDYEGKGGDTSWVEGAKAGRLQPC